MNGLKLLYQIMLSVCGVVAFVFVVFCSVSVSRTTEMAVTGAESIALEMGARYGDEVKLQIEKALNASVVFRSSLEAMAASPEKVNRELIDEMQKKLVLSEKSFFGVQAVFEPNRLDGKDDAYRNYNEYHDESGMYSSYFFRGQSGIKGTNLKRDHILTREWYQVPQSGKQCLTEPYVSEVAGGGDHGHGDGAHHAQRNIHRCHGV